MNPTIPRLKLVEVTVHCLCDCACHNGRCFGTIDLARGDCDRDCRGTQSTIVCDPFVERDLDERLHRVEPGEDDR